MTNKKLILLQSRGVRHVSGGDGKGSTEKGKESFSSSNEDGSSSHEKTDPQKLEAEFYSKLAESLNKYRADVLMGVKKAKKDDIRNARNEFINKFNEKHAKSGYKMELSEMGKKYGKFIPLVIPTTFFLILILVWPLRPRGGVKPEHKAIVDQPAITFSQFVQDYLPTGEVDMIFHYPIQNLVVAFLHSGAVINGEMFTAPGLHIALDESFRFQPMALTQQIREEERRIGVRESIPIATRMVSFGSLMFYYLGTFGLCYFAGIQLTRQMFKFRNQMFRAVPIHPKGGDKPKKN